MEAEAKGKKKLKEAEKAEEAEGRKSLILPGGRDDVWCLQAADGKINFAASWLDSNLCLFSIKRMPLQEFAPATT